MSKVKLNLYPGRDAQSNYRAFHMQNFIYVSHNNEARDIFFHNILVELLQRGSIEDFNLHIMYRDSKWVDVWIPEPPKQKEYTRIKCIPWMTTIMDAEDARTQGLLESIKSSESTLDVVYLDNIEDLNEEEMEVLTDLIVNPCVFVWIVTDSVSKIPKDILDAIMLRFAGPLSNEEMVQLFGKGVQISDANEQNVVLACRGYNQIPEVLFTPFRPNTLLQKIIKAYSVWKDLKL